MLLDYLTDLIIGFVFSIFFISTGFILALNFKTLYYNDIEVLKIEQEASLDNEVIKENYDALIKYLQPNTKGDLVLPNFTLSESGTKHFIEVKNVFKIVYLLAIFSGIMCLVIAIMKIRSGDYQFILTSAIVSIIIPAGLFFVVLTDFKDIYDKICSSVFNQANWPLQVKTDPIATMLPEQYFYHSGIALVAYTLICGIAMMIIWRGLKQRGAC